ncbi:hypothetical protein LX32DRAFT_664044 [Colletotrichum zoysiae]|uniref:Uncharacterized protein n=1 Tax=Colletotrichum zoysiae TaxID=1216348 RepID=A0AAD9HHN9_9PEZI|nr:hypothetical protein LX32DRAFT_664044 [Colletotrichum zoysiae]
MADFGDTGKSKRPGDDAGGRGKRRRLEPAQRLFGENPVNGTGQQGSGHARRTKAPPAVSDPVAVYRKGRYIPTGAGGPQMPLPEFLRAETGDPNRPKFSVPPGRRPAVAKPQNNAKAVRVCPQCREVPLGPGPVVDGEPTYPVCEDCRQSNIRRQVLRATAAQALVELGRRAASLAPPERNGDRAQEDVRGRFLNGLGRLPQRAQEPACLRCKRPDAPLAPGRRRCAECICILIAFGPDEGEEQAAANILQGLRMGQKKRAAEPDQQRQQPQDEHWHMCDGCFKKPVPPGERKCPGCVARFAQMHRDMRDCGWALLGLPRVSRVSRVRKRELL